jgi:hypothetical protein
MITKEQSIVLNRHVCLNTFCQNRKRCFSNTVKPYCMCNTLSLVICVHARCFTVFSSSPSNFLSKKLSLPVTRPSRRVEQFSCKESVEQGAHAPTIHTRTRTHTHTRLTLSLSLVLSFRRYARGKLRDHFSVPKQRDCICVSYVSFSKYPSCCRCCILV